MTSLFPLILANPIYVPPTEYAHPAFSPMAISAIEGLLLGIVIWRWTRSRPSIILLGFLINLVTLALFWASVRREEHIWEYDYRMVAIGEVLVVAVEALAIVVVVRKFAVISPRLIWWKAFGFSLGLNALSFFAGAFLAYSPISANKTSLLTLDPPPVPGVMTATTSAHCRSLAPGQA